MRAPVPEQAAQERAGHGTSEEEESMSSLTQLTRAQRTLTGALRESGGLAQGGRVYCGIETASFSPRAHRRSAAVHLVRRHVRARLLDAG